MEISIATQKKHVVENSAKKSIKVLLDNLEAPEIDTPLDIDETQYSNTHLLKEHEGWEPPNPDVVTAYFRQFQKAFPEYRTDKKLAQLLGVSSDRRIRGFKNGDLKLKYDVWRHFLVITGRVPQDVIKVLGFFK